MSDNNTGQPSASLPNTQLSYADLNQQPHTAKGAGAPFNAKSSFAGLGGFGAPGLLSENLPTVRPSLPENGGSGAAKSSFSTTIAPNTTLALDDARSLTPASFPQALALSASSSAATKPLNGGPDNAPPFFHNHLRHGHIQREAPPGGFNDAPLPEPNAAQHLSALLPRTTTDAASSLRPAPDTPTSRLATSANGSDRPDASSSNSPAVVNKPVLKMRRTGQNFPLNSGIGSFQRRNSSYSPSQRQPLPLPGNATGKAPGLNTKDGQQGQTMKNGETKPLDVIPAEKLDVPFKTGPNQGLRSPGDVGSVASKPNASGGSTNNGSASKTTATVLNSDMDDIIYEMTAQTGTLDGAVEDIADNDLSSDNSNSHSDDEDDESDDDEAAELDAGEAYLRQLFRAPDQEDDYDDSADDSRDGSEEDDDDDDDDDDETSESSFIGGSVGDEPAVALPSAQIQHQEAYPSTILDMAEPGRLYTEWRDKGVNVKAGPALFPVNYGKCTTFKGFPWVCAVRSCRLLYKTSAGLANHARFTHKKAMFNDNMDGTVSLVGFYSKKNQSGHYPPVVVSKRPSDPKEPPMREPAIPANKKLSKRLRSNPKNFRMLPKIPILDRNDVVMGDGDADSLELQKTLPPRLAVSSRSSEQMWEYIQPFLSNHTSLPDINWARHIIHLPRVRNIKWNEVWNKGHPFKDSHPRDITALIVQVTGVESPTPCHHCAAGRGPFVGCIVISPEAPDEVKSAVLSCANCYYHCGQSSCSLCKNAVPRRVRRSRATLETASYNVKLLSDVAHRRAAKAMLANGRQVLSGSMTALEAPARSNLRLYLPSEFKSIEKATSERTYKVIKGLDGKDVLMCGALIPEGYDLDRTVPGYPWICPIRSCRRIFKKIVSLGSHFVRAHPGCLLNDNQDGTLSHVGNYNTPLPGSNGLPALIISQNPLDPKEPPMETAGLPGQASQAPKLSKHKINIKIPPSTAHTQSMSLSTGRNKELWDYMRPYLPKSLTSISSDSKALSLFSLPRQRDIRWRTNSPHVEVEDDKRQILGLLIYLTGEVYKNGERSCTHCVKRIGPFPDCMTLTKGVPEDAQSMVRSCANCVFTHKSSSCSIKSGWSKEADERAQSEGAGKKRVWATDDESEVPAAMRRRSDRLGFADEDDNMGPRKKTRDGREPGRESGPSGAVRMPGLLKTVSNGSVSRTQSSSALIHAGQVQPDDLLEMEDWEIAPGRIRGTDADGINNNLAFSKSYLETNQAVKVSRDVTFEVKTIKSGNNLELEADQTKTRYCTLASGKLNVNIDEQESFSIGPHGLFKLAPGSTVKIQNRLYIDSVLHISTYAEG